MAFYKQQNTNPTQRINSPEEIYVIINMCYSLARRSVLRKTVHETEGTVFPKTNPGWCIRFSFISKFYFYKVGETILIVKRKTGKVMFLSSFVFLFLSCFETSLFQFATSLCV